MIPAPVLFNVKVEAASDAKALISTPCAVVPILPYDVALVLLSLIVTDEAASVNVEIESAPAPEMFNVAALVKAVIVLYTDVLVVEVFETMFSVPTTTFALSTGTNEATEIAEVFEEVPTVVVTESVAPVKS